MKKKEIILQTTLRLIANQGITTTPMSQIMEESGVATGTIYHHFKSKDEIINYLYVSEKKFFEKIADDVLVENEISFKIYTTLFTAIYDYYIANPFVFHFFLQVSKSPIIEVKSIEKGKESYAKIAFFFEKGIEKNQFTNINIELLLDLLHANISTFVEMVLAGKTASENLTQIINYSWKGIQKTN